ncbi:MAG: hypothetical protein V2J10_01500 [Wenzhouxiangella sp.]|jgi:hypothetical protein|nr:hypothetical protein [Wenzhouxiangella sp.]
MAFVICTEAPAAERPELELVVDSALQRPAQEWREWIDLAVDAVAGVGGEFPVPRVNVYLHEGPEGQPITFGWVRRNSPPEVHFRVSPSASHAELIDEWHAFHEFAHLLLPFSGNQDIWFAEGLASYYQYFLQARAGVIDADEAWQRLLAGFQRGFDDPSGEGEPLVRLSPRMWRLSAFRRVYWSGAAFFLRVDHGLREASGHRHSLDRTLAAFAACCIDDGSRRWTALTLVERLGELSLPEVWRQEYDRAMRSRAAPDFGSAGGALGLVLEGERLSLREDSVSVGRRRALALGHRFDRAQQPD